MPPHHAVPYLRRRRRWCERVYDRWQRDACVDMSKDMCTGMRAGMCADVRIDKRTDLLQAYATHHRKALVELVLKSAGTAICMHWTAIADAHIEPISCEMPVPSGCFESSAGGGGGGMETPAGACTRNARFARGERLASACRCSSRPGTLGTP